MLPWVGQDQEHGPQRDWSKVGRYQHLRTPPDPWVTWLSQTTPEPLAGGPSRVPRQSPAGGEQGPPEVRVVGLTRRQTPQSDARRRPVTLREGVSPMADPTSSVLPGDKPSTPVFVSPLEAARILGLSRTVIYDLMDQGRLRSARHGSRRLVVLSSVYEFARQLGA